MFTYLLIYRRFTFKTETSVIYKLIKMLLALVVDASSPCGIQRAPDLAPKAASRTLAMYALKRKIMTKATKRTVGKQRVCFFFVCFLCPVFQGGYIRGTKGTNTVHSGHRE